ncbi:LRR 8 domain containing protein [Asbolus verrucosus]|uniref:LRR 8 domain containing protein n=1 Tax=Asbolus verrucosus TaxID=1661398 RepID=A0A482VGZ5_ASBVE|nr:LRR 8 domain containing protein [Asbolus verrucosus]
MTSKNLERLVIIGQLKRIESSTFRDNLFLKFIILYRNDLNTIRAFTFYFESKLKLLDLKNNNIEDMKSRSVFNVQIQTVDLSYNRLSILLSDTFTYCFVVKLLIKHNKLSKIETGGVPETVNSLHLDYKNFHFLATKQIDNLKELEELTISHNKQSHVDNFSVFRQLKNLDVSISPSILTNPTIGTACIYCEIKAVFCKCEETFWIACESLDDVSNHDITKRSWTQLSIEPKKCDETPPDGTLGRYDLAGLNNLEQLFIIKQLKRIEYKAFDHALKQSLRYLVLYGNSLGYFVRRHTFIFDYLKKLSLVNNSITYIDPCVFQNSKIETVDLSHNQQQLLPDYMFCRCHVTKLIVRHNKLSKIRTNALPEGLRFLHLDHNDFYFLSTTQLNNTSQIEELTLSHNRFTFVDDLSALQSLKKLDISFNNIHKVSNEFDSLKHLTVLNLSGNNLIKFSFPALVTNNSSTHFLILLAYNRLKNLHLDPTKAVTLALFGNPWNCRCLRNMEKILLSSPRYVNSIPCREVELHSDRIPYCTMIDSYYDECNDDQIPDEQFLLFRRLFGTDKCDSVRIFQEHSLYVPTPPILFGYPSA